MDHAMSRIHRTIHRLGHVVSGELLLRAANLGFAVLIGRRYGVRILGIYATVFAVATLAERFADNGLQLAGIVVMTLSFLRFWSLPGGSAATQELFTAAAEFTAMPNS
jgi:hypothetical protein